MQRLERLIFVISGGNYKWSDKYYAMEIAKKWCRCGGDWKAFEEQTEDMNAQHKQKN